MIKFCFFLQEERGQMVFVKRTFSLAKYQKYAALFSFTSATFIHEVIRLKVMRFKVEGLRSSLNIHHSKIATKGVMPHSDAASRITDWFGNILHYIWCSRVVRDCGSGPAMTPRRSFSWGNFGCIRCSLLVYSIFAVSQDSQLMTTNRGQIVFIKPLFPSLNIRNMRHYLALLRRHSFKVKHSKFNIPKGRRNVPRGVAAFNRRAIERDKKLLESRHGRW